MYRRYFTKFSNVSKLTDDSGFQVDEDGTGHVLSSASLAEEGVEGVVATSDGLVTGHLAIRLDSVLQAVQFPAGVADLDSGLSDVDRDALTLKYESCRTSRNQRRVVNINKFIKSLHRLP